VKFVNKIRQSIVQQFIVGEVQLWVHVIDIAILHVLWKIYRWSKQHWFRLTRTLYDFLLVFSCEFSSSWNRYRVISIHNTRHSTHCVKTWRHPRNRKYITYRNAVEACACTKFWYSAVWFLRYDARTNRQQTDMITTMVCNKYFFAAKEVNKTF